MLKRSGPVKAVTLYRTKEILSYNTENTLQSEDFVGGFTIEIKRVEESPSTQSHNTNS
jgi:hypothetical protein